jgi:hypothetical protein
MLLSPALTNKIIQFTPPSTKPVLNTEEESVSRVFAITQEKMHCSKIRIATPAFMHKLILHVVILTLETKTRQE